MHSAAKRSRVSSPKRPSTRPGESDTAAAGVSGRSEPGPLTTGSPHFEFDDPSEQAMFAYHLRIPTDDRAGAHMRAALNPQDHWGDEDYSEPCALALILGIDIVVEAELRHDPGFHIRYKTFGWVQALCSPGELTERLRLLATAWHRK